MLGNVDLKFYLSIFMRRVPYFVVIVALLSAIGIAVASMLPPVYRSTAAILVESQQIPGDLARSTVPVNPIEQIQIIEQRLMTRANILTLANRFNIYADQPGVTADDIVSDMRSRVTFTPAGGGGGARNNTPGATIIDISFSSENPAEAADITNELVTLILQENVSLRTGRAGDTLDFFENEVERLSGEMERLSQRIMEFQSRNDTALPDSLAFRRNQQTLLQERMLQLEREASALQDNRARMVRIYERTGQISGMAAEARSPAEAELADLRRELSRQRVIYAANNPRIRLLESRIAALETEVAEQNALLDDGMEGMSPLDLQLADIDGRLEFIAEEKARMEADLAELEESIQATPANALVLEGLERDYRNVQGQYNAAVDRLAAASMGERIEVMSKGERFTLVEPAVAPTSPEKPNRILIAGAGVAGGLGAGLGFIVLLELLNRSIRRPVELSNKLGIQPFATIPYIHTRQETRWKRGVIGGILALIVIGIPALLFAIHTYYLPIDLLMRQMLGRIGLGGIF
jgi:polysaccharide biosynthesis transport protein